MSVLPVQLFYRVEYVHDVVEVGMRHTFDVLRSRRDRFVTELLRGRGIPMAVVMAGGYGPLSWRIYRNYFNWLLGPANLRARP